MKEITCGLVMPISQFNDYTSEHWSEVRDIIVSALKESESYTYEIKIVSEDDGSSIIQNSIVTGLYESDIIICDISGANPNVMFELGMRLAFDKPVLIIKDELSRTPFDINIIKYIEYDSTLRYKQTVDFKFMLLNEIESTVKKIEQGNLRTYLSTFQGISVKNIEYEQVTGSEAIEKIFEEVLEISSMLKNNRKIMNVNYIDKKFIADILDSDDEEKYGLTDREHNILRLRYGIDDGIERHNDVISKVFGVSERTIETLIRSGLGKIISYLHFE